ncbi:hypothetical protein CCHL11_05891 [Colletotrichum chlorophyti]|uniref:Uncharacterized protein n=1 Tax=Colletotrichum chlorophyti TaxID=708187 RepID=A0A1Q8RJ14_9PEZI|nr:hypothetical protein CCHL11_05891 [Colletotrichum chlorophyti]
MTSNENENSWEDLDTDEIRSVDSDELYNTRPNRWRGNKSTWRAYTQEERLLYHSMEELRNRDLSVHLYNAFALKNRPVRPSGTTEPSAEDADRPLEEIVDSTDWRPPNLWTAWPMNAKNVPGDDFMKETHDEDDEFTVRSRTEKMPSTVLEDELTATILRQAKERFRRRQRKSQQKEDAARARRESAPETTAASSQSAHSAVTSDGDDSDDVQSDEKSSVKTAQPDTDDRKVKPPKTYRAVISANDDLSATLLRPSVRHILSNLDNTLTCLHNARLAGLSYMTDSSASATDASDASDAVSVSSAASRGSSASSRRSRKGRPRSKAPRTPTFERDPSERRGRPKKAHVPLPGETEKEMRIRIAREQKKRIPFSSDEEDNNSDDTDENRSAHQRPGSGPQTPRSKSPRKRRDLPPAEAKVEARERMLGSWGLRDWSDVIGAASLSGFGPDVVARAAQRCADLFGQGMEIQTLAEGPATKGPRPQTTRYLPAHRARAPSPWSSDSENDRPTARRRTLNQRVGLRQDSVPPSDSDAARGRRSRSTSRTSSVGLFVCPVAGCERAAEGFGRRANLQRHVARVHPGQAVDVGDVESENEMFGAVHVDGFLKPIRARKGWRAEDMGMRKRKRHYRGRRMDGNGGSEGSGLGEESVFDST